MKSLMISVEQKQGWSIVKISGAMIENIEDQLNVIASQAGENCILDFCEVTSINSSGIAEWLSFRKTLNPGRVVVMQRCPSVIVDVMNMIEAFTDRTVVRSVFLPFACSKCGREKPELLEIEPGITVSKIVFPHPNCASCLAVMYPQVEPDEYLNFLNKNH